MKKIVTFISLVLICLCGYTQTIDPALLEEMGQRRGNEKIRVFVIMRQQYDQQQLNRQAAYYTTRAARREFVVNELKQFSEASQYDLRRTLAELQQGDRVSEPKVLWIANAISFEATRDAILSLADRSDIMVIGFDEERNWLPDGEESQPVNPTREITSNVIQVNANQVWNLGYTGQGVVVAVIDTGVNYDHLDLADHLWDGGPDFPYHGYDFYNNDNDPMDDHGHGTHCAGTICGDGTAGSQTGMAPDASLMILKCLNAGGSGSSTAVMNSMQWAVEHGCDIISMSLGGHGHSPAEQTLERNTCVNVLNAGVIASIAAGNEGDEMDEHPIPDNVGLPGGCPPPYLDPQQALNPGGLSCSVCVGAVDSDDQAAGFTSQGPRDWSESDYADYPYTPGSLTEFGLIRPDVCAPGVYIKSANYSSNNGYSIKSGTSMATPCVAGCMALMLSKDMEITPADVCRILEETTVPLSSGKSNIYGYGRVDVLAAINAMNSGPLTLDSFTVNDSQGNNDGKLNPGEAVTLNLTLTNDSGAALNGATLVLTTQSEYVTITNSTVSLPSFNAGQTRTISNMFAFTLSDNAPARSNIQFKAKTFVNGESIGAFMIGITVYDHTLRFVEVTVLNDNNGNGSLEAGETANLHVTVTNVGNEPASSIVGALSTTYPYLTINGNNKTFGDIGIGQQVSADYNVTLASNAPDNYSIDFSLDLVDANQKHTIIGFEFWRKAITLTSNPAGAGTLSGEGYYGIGQICTINAEANEGYAFVSWTLNGTVVSYLPSYTFEVTGEAQYVANFLTVTNGVVIGDGAGTEDHLPSYSYYCYSLSQQIYTADELNLGACDISSVSFFNAGYTMTRSYDIYMVHTDKAAFNGSSDWIAVSEENLLFSGSVTMNNGVWTTIYFSTPFAYDGSSNVALIVDDNTGSWSNSMSCRVDAADNQAMYAYSDYTDYQPNDPSSYYGTQLSVKNQVIFHFPSTITATAIPTGGGTVSGAGSYSYGATCTLTATPNTGYYFLNWTENGEVVSYDINYSFTVNGDRNLVANFAQGESTCGIVFDFYDSFGDGWNGNYLVIDYGDGTSEQLTLEDGISGSFTREVETGSTLTLSWISGSWTYECSFDISFENGVPIYHGANLNSSFNEVLNINCATAIALHAITLAANPEEGGTVAGAGTYQAGTALTVAAIPNSGYTFAYWSEDGVEVSSEASYSFTVTSDRNLVAHFSLPLTISVTTNMSEGGTATGSGTFDYGETCTLTATPNEGYLFLNWNINGTVISCNATYSFSVTEDADIEAVFMLLEGTLIGEGELTNEFLPSYSYYCYTLSQQIYTPDEIGEAGSINSISYFNAGNTETRNYDIYMVHTDKTVFESTTDWIAVTEADLVYSGNVTMTQGYWTTILLDTPFAYDGTSNLAIVFDDNTGSWTNAPNMACRVFNTNGTQAIRVYSDSPNYDPYNPSEYNGTRYAVKNQIILGIETGIEQTVMLSQGTNWFSTYLDITLDDLKAALVAAMPNNSAIITIKSKSQNTRYNNGRWSGSLTTFDVTQMYKIIIPEACEISFEGVPIDPSAHTVTITPGVNWIAFPYNESMTVMDFFGSFPINNDVVKSKFQNTRYNNGRWGGQLNTLIPGQGYIYNSAATVERTFVFPASAK